LGQVQAARQNNDADSVDAAGGRLKCFAGIFGENFIRSDLP